MNAYKQANARIRKHGESITFKAKRSARILSESIENVTKATCRHGIIAIDSLRVADMPTIEEVLQQKEAELDRLQKEVEALRIAARIMARAEAGKSTSRSTQGKSSQPLMAKAVLEAHHREMHVKEIADSIKAKFGAEIKPSYLAPVLYRQIDNLFYKAEQPNTFGLLEWRRNAEHHAPVNSDPHRSQAEVTNGALNLKP